VDELIGSTDRIATETQFSGVVRVDIGGDIAFTRAYGLANRAHGIPNAIDTQFGIASGVKGLTALTVVGLIWLHPSNATAMLKGYDAGVSFSTAHDPTRRITYTVISNTSPGAWPLVRALDDALGTTPR
jgi:hypothetical protein